MLRGDVLKMIMLKTERLFPRALRTLIWACIVAFALICLDTISDLITVVVGPYVFGSERGEYLALTLSRLRVDYLALKMAWNLPGGLIIVILYRYYKTGR